MTIINRLRVFMHLGEIWNVHSAKYIKYPRKTINYFENGIKIRGLN